MLKVLSREVLALMLGLTLSIGTVAQAQVPDFLEDDVDAITAPANIDEDASAEYQYDETETDDGLAPIATDQPEPAILDHVETELIQERYANTAIKVERQVTQDSDGNYVNHGSWTMWDEKGHMVAKGEYRNGKRHGSWARWFRTGEGDMFTGPLYKDFERPFISEANFQNGVLEGAWTVLDNKGRAISDWNFKNDVQDGIAIWFDLAGNKRREVNFRNGRMDGELVEWGATAKVVKREVYRDGRRLGLDTQWYKRNEQKRAERACLYPASMTAYNWMEGSAKTTPVGNQEEKVSHGLSTWWHENGQKQVEGRYDEGHPVGEFTWWHTNGQKQSVGQYTDGQQQGKWVWWHINGQKQFEGEYDSGRRIGKWSKWKEDGKLLAVEDVGEGSDTDDGLQAFELPTETSGATRVIGPRLKR